MHKYLYLSLLLLCWNSIAAIAQTQTQLVKGKVLDKDTKLPLIGVSIYIADTDPVVGTTSDENGNFELANVPVGRPTIQAQYLGYAPYSLILLVTTGKEVYTDIELSESVQTTEEVVVTASNNGVPNQALNDLSVVSSRSFSVEETQRYPSSINDPGRMAMAFAGVQSNQDNENEIVIRGNAAAGLLWRVEGLDIPNPNHFARPYSTGGGITVFSASLLSNSDFSTGAFAAEYGNAFSGVFDMRFRKGNLSKREYTARVGMVGLDFATEGPIQKGRSSYLVNYRFSTLGLLDLMGLHIVRENVTNVFQDLAFNLAFNSKNNRNVFTVFGMAGTSMQHWKTKADTAQWLTALDYIAENYGSNIGVLGTTFTKTLDDKSYLKMVLGGIWQQTFDTQDEPMRSNPSIKTRLVDRNYYNTNISFHITYSRKFNNHWRFKAGYIGTMFLYKLYYGYYVNNTVGFKTFLNNLQGATYLGQTYAQASYQLNKFFTFNAGLHSLLLALNGTYTVEPRAGIRYQATEKTTFSFGYGLHGKMLPVGTYLLTFQDSLGANYQPNTKLKMPKSHHFILSYQQLIGKSMRLQLETYYQQMWDVPVAADTLTSSPTYWFYNMRDNVGDMPMTSKGKGRNYGVDMVFEKGFSRGYFFLISGSLFWSQYQTQRNEWRSTRIDSRWITSVMASKEFTFKKGGVLQIGWKMFLNGGMRFTPPDTDASTSTQTLILNENLAYSGLLGTYFRMDARIAYRKNTPKLSYIVAFDVQNFTSQLNFKEFLYDRIEAQLVKRYQPTILPILSFQIDF